MTNDLPTRIDEAEAILLVKVNQRDVDPETIAQVGVDFDRIRDGDGDACLELAPLALAMGLPLVEKSLYEIGIELGQPECMVETAARVMMFGDRDRAVELLERAVALDYPSAHGQLAQRLQVEDPERCKALIDRGIELGDAYSHMLVGDLASDSGNLEEACAAYGRAALMGLEIAQTRMLEVEDARVIGDFGLERFGSLPWDIRYQPPILWIFDSAAGLLQLDEEWSLQEEEGWSWWPHVTRVRVTCERLTTYSDFPGWHVTLETDLLRGIADPDDSFYETVAEVSGLLPLCGLVFDEERGTLRIASTFVMHTSGRPIAWWFRSVLAQMSITHAALATGLVGMHEMLGCEIDMTSPDGRPIRQEPDDVLGVWDLLRQKGEEPSMFAGVQMLILRKQLEQPQRDFDEIQIEASVEAQSIGDHPVTRMLSIQICDDPPAFVHVLTEAENPFVGNGVLAMLAIQGDAGAAASPRLLVHLNALDIAARNPWGCHGSWSGGNGDLVFNTFILNSFAEFETGISNLSYALFHRFRWLISEALDLPQERREQILANHAAWVGDGYGVFVG